MIEVHEAIARILAGIPVLPATEVALRDALGRVLAEDVSSPIDIPPHTNSAMDGYAARSADVRGATRDAPRRLRVLESVPAGHVPSLPVREGEATRIFTGAPLPEGVDGVIRQEDTETAGDEVIVFDDRDAGRNFRLAGEDLKRGSLALAQGTTLGPAQLGILASVARPRVTVVGTPRVAILASGDEVADLDAVAEILSGRKIASSNSYTLHALITEAGAIPVPMGIARDTLASVRDQFARAMKESDLIVSTAGVSVGEHDFVRDALKDLGATMDFWRVRMRPGSPLGFAHLNGIPWIGLPGNPVSTMVCFELYVRPAIRKMQGRRDLHRRAVRATLAEPVTTSGRLMHFLRAVAWETDGGWSARLTGPQGSGILTSMALANALLVVPPDRNQIPAGEQLPAILISEPGSYLNDVNW